MTEEQASILIEKLDMILEYQDTINQVGVEQNQNLLIIGFLLMVYFGINIGRAMFGR